MPRARHWPLYLAFGCSGGAALIYETAWTRLLGLTMGHTVAAATTVLAAFMAGLAIGASVAGRIAPRLETRTALVGFARIEILVAALAAALPLEIAALRPLLVMAYADGDGGLLFAVVRGSAAALVVTVPAVAMGATLPLLVRWAAGPAATAAALTSRLYASNTVGATAGAILAGFVLLPSLGLRRTTAVAVVLNIASAAIAWRMSKTPSGPQKIAKPAAARQSTDSHASAAVVRSRAVAAAALAASGAASLILQIVWTRLLALLVGPTTYAFSAMVASFIAGIAMGSLAGGWLGRKGPSPGLLAASLLLSGVAAVAAAALSPGIALAVATTASAPGSGFAGVMQVQFAVIAASMLPMTLAFGAAFPLAVGLVVRADRPIARDVAWIYTANTIGAIAGALAGGHVLIPRLGLQGSLRVAALAAITGAAAVAIVMTGRRRRVFTLLGTTAAAAAIWFAPGWDRALLSSGAYKYSAYLPDDHREVLLRAGSLLYYREGSASTVSVRRVAGSVSLAIDGKIDASNAGDMLTQRLLAHVPLLLHPNPRRVAIIGLGSGVTLGSALTHPVERVDTIEISPEVVEASAHFSRENRRALTDPRSHLIVGDGRTHMTLGRGLYDVVISEPSNPWIAGVAGLFTREMFEAIRARLAPGGLVCQWAHAYDMSGSDLRSIVATFIDVFPEATLWPVGDGDVLLVGSEQSIESRLPLARSNWQRQGVSDDLADVRVTGPDLLLSLAAAGNAALRSFAMGTEIQRDDRLALEFTGPHSVFGHAADAVALLRTLDGGQGAPELAREIRNSPARAKARGLMLLGAEAFEPAVPELLRAVGHDPDDIEVVDGLIRAAAPVARIDEVERHLRAVMSQDGGHRAAAIGVSRILASRGEFDEAESVIRPLAEAKADVAVLEQMASVYADARDPNRLSAAVSGLRSMAPAAEPTLYFSAVLELMTGRPNEALRIVAQLRAGGGVRPRDLTIEGAALAALGRKEQARQSFEAALAAEPRSITGYENLAAFEEDAGNDRTAAALFAEALILDSSSAVARTGLARTLRRQR